jgi:hypothetical protein
MVIVMSVGDNSWLVYQSSLIVLRAETSGESRRNGKSENFPYQYLKYLKGSLTSHKILRYGISGFTSNPKEGMLRIFIAPEGFERATFGSSNKHNNHYTTEATVQEYSSYSFLTSTGDVSGQRHALSALYPQERTPLPIRQEAS